MKLSLQIPLHTKSENVLRSLPFAVARVAKTKGVKAANGLAIAIAQRVTRQRAEVRRFLDSQLPKLKGRLEDSTARADAWDRSKPNFYRVTLIRISAGELDTDGLHGALKAVRDEVAAWLGIDDSARSPASWRVAQQKCPRGMHAVRIEIEDDDPTTAEQIGRPSAVIVGTPIAKLGPVVGDLAHAPRSEMDRLNEAYRRENAGLEASGPRLSVAEVARGLGMTAAQLREMAPLKCAEIERRASEHHQLDAHLRANPGDRMHAPAPRGLDDEQRHRANGRSGHQHQVKQAPLVFRRSYYAPPGQDEDAEEVTLEELTGPPFEVLEPPPVIRKGGRILHRRRESHPALGEHWIYEPAPSVARAHHERAEATR